MNAHQTNLILNALACLLIVAALMGITKTPEPRVLVFLGVVCFVGAELSVKLANGQVTQNSKSPRSKPSKASAK